MGFLFLLKKNLGLGIKEDKQGQEAWLNTTHCFTSILASLKPISNGSLLSSWFWKKKKYSFVN